MAELEVFWDSGSPYVWRVLLALEVKQVPYTSRPIQFSKGEHKTPEFLAMNDRRRSHHFRVQLRARAQQPHQKAAMAIGPIHHRGD